MDSEAVCSEPEEVKPTNEDPSDLEKKIIRQIEYYFGDQNIVRDKFLKEKITEDDGWVALECLIKFNRLKALSSDFGVIMAALKKSNNEILELDSDGNKLRRSTKKPVPNSEDPVLKQQSKNKTVYVKGFPENYDIDQLEEYFEDKGKVVFIKMRRHADKSFKGSIFAEFQALDDVKKFIEMKDLKIGETELIKMHRDEYYKIKEEERRLLRDQEKSTKMSQYTKYKKELKEENDAKEDEEPERQPGCVLHFTGVRKGTSREDIKGVFGEHQPITWVDFNRGDTEGHIRFKNAGAAEKASVAVKEANDGKIIINDEECTVKVVEGEEEEKFWANVKAADTKVRQDNSYNRRGGGRSRGFGRGRGRGFRGGRGGGRDRDRDFGGGRGGGRFRKGNKGGHRDRDGNEEEVKTEKKEEPQGQHMHFNEEDHKGSEKMEEDEKKVLKRPAEKDVSESEPSIKQTKTELVEEKQVKTEPVEKKPAKTEPVEEKQIKTEPVKEKADKPSEG